MNKAVVIHIGLNLLVFKIAWIITALSAARGTPWIGVVSIGLVLVVHLWFAKDAREELILAGLCAVVGICWDSIPVAMGWIQYPSGMLWANVAPYWIIAIWVLFATTLNVTFDFLKERLWLAAILGAVFGPVSYWSGAGLGALEFLEPFAALVALAVAWAIFMPLLMILAKRFDGIQLGSLVGSTQ